LGITITHNAKTTASMGKLLVAVDGSEPSKRAINLAFDLAKKFNSKVYVLHVIDSRAANDLSMPELNLFSKPGEEFSISREENEFVDKVCEQLLDPAEKILAKAGIDVETVCASGHPADQILDAAKKYKVDAVIMGNRGRGMFSKAMMGSVSSKVCNHAETTCITVK